MFKENGTGQTFLLGVRLAYTQVMLLAPMTPALKQRSSLADYFVEFAGLGEPYLVFDNGFRSWSYSYAQVGAAARRCSAKLAAHGITKGEKVIFWSENRPEWVAAFWGCVISGVIVVPVDYRASAEFLHRIQRLVNARAVWIGEEVRLEPSPDLTEIWRLADLDWTDAGSPVSRPSMQPQDVAEIVFTSGATGEPKGVLITHRNILSNLASPEIIITKYVKWFRPVFPLRFLSLVPLSHMFGQALTLFLLPLIPGVAVFMHGFSPHEILRQIRSRRVSIAIVVPKLMEILREHILQHFPEAAQRLPHGIHWTRRWWLHRRIHGRFGWKFWGFLAGAAPLDAGVEEFWSNLGFLVVQGYGLTETAPIVSFNNPFAVRKGTVGRPVKGTEIKIAEDGEVLVRGESVSPGYYRASPENAATFDSGWLHTGDIGALDDTGRLTIRGRKKEVIVTPEGLKVFPEDVEKVLNATHGVRESAVVGPDHPHAVLLLDPGVSPEEVIRGANQALEDHQKIRTFSVWSGDRLPRTAGTEKLRRSEIRRWVESGAAASPQPSGDGLTDILRQYAPGRSVEESTTLDQLGLSSLDRVELMMELEQRLNTSVDESSLSGSRTIRDLRKLSSEMPLRAAPAAEKFPTWSRSRPARLIRNTLLFAVWLPLTRLFAWPRIRGREHLNNLSDPVIFASNHQSHMDTPCILAALPARYRSHSGVAMWKEFFDAHFHPERHTKLETLGNRLLYWLLALFFNAFPLPQTETGVGGSVRYLGELISAGWSVIFFPEGERTEAGEIHRFLPGIGLLASRLRVPVVPVRLQGVEKILHRGKHFPTPGRVRITFGQPLYLNGNEYPALARQVEQAVREL